MIRRNADRDAVIRRLALRGEMRLSDIASKYGISVPRVSQIAGRKRRVATISIEVGGAAWWALINEAHRRGVGPEKVASVILHDVLVGVAA